MNRIGKNGVLYSSNFLEIGPAGSLLHYWPLNGHLQNYGSRYELLTNNGASIGSAGPRDRQYYTFASTDYMDVPWGNGVNPYPLTVSVWCTGTTTGDILFGAANGSSQRFYVGTNNSTWVMGIAGSSWGTQDFTPAAGWNHIALTMTDPGGGTGTATLYVNGVADSTTKSYSAYVLASDVDLGRLSGSSYNWQGDIMEFRIYDRVLTAAEVAILAKAFDTDASSRTEMAMAETAWYMFGEFKD